MSKSWDMRYYWLRDELKQQQFDFSGRKEPTTTQITSLNTTQPNTIDIYEVCTFMRNLVSAMW